VNPDDPFAEFDEDGAGRTVLRPTPGGRAPSGAGTAIKPAADASNLRRLPLSPGLNALESAAASLLALLTRLRTTISHSDPAALRNQVIEEIRVFESEARSLGVDAQNIQIARYVLCTALDEIVLNTPWGRTSEWSSQSLLAYFHNEVAGGERFFALLNKLIEDPARNLPVLELMYVCLSLGFEGRYRVMENGRSKLEEQRDRLYRTIRNQRGDAQRDLSAHWRGVVDKRNPLIRFVPLWVVAAIGAVALVATYIGFSYNLGTDSDLVLTELSTIGRDAAVEPAKQKRKPIYSPNVTQVAPVSAGPSMKKLLAKEIAQGLVHVKEDAKSATIVIRSKGKGLFQSGSARLRSAYVPLLDRIAESLNAFAGKVEVTGHTDSIPIRTPRYPSNWHLSQARAESVAKVLSTHVIARNRLTAEGRADTEPTAPNTTPEGRANNRRVEILVGKA
jgi:type VI secretion system protein ImpK